MLSVRSGFSGTGLVVLAAGFAAFLAALRSARRPFAFARTARSRLARGCAILLTLRASRPLAESMSLLMTVAHDWYSAMGNSFAGSNDALVSCSKASIMLLTWRDRYFSATFRSPWSL